MKRTSLLALALIGGCVDAPGDVDPGGGGGKADNGTTFGNVTTAWELTVGYGGDADVAGVLVQPDGKLLVRSHFPHWLHRVTPDGKFDTTFGHKLEWGNQRSGSLDVTAWDVWPVASDRFITPAGDGALFELRSFMTADGSDNAAFGTAGRVPLIATGGIDDRTIGAAYDKLHHRVLALVVREWQRNYTSATSYWEFGPSKIEMIAYDDTTGAPTSLGVFQMPGWTGSGSSQPRTLRLVPQPDGSLIALIAEPIYKSLNDPATRWLQVHFRVGQAPELTTLAVTEYDPPTEGFVELPDGAYEFYVSGRVDGISTSRDDRKLVRISVDASLTPKLTVIDAGLTQYASCRTPLATPGYLLIAQSPDRSKPIDFTVYPKSGAPFHFKSDKPQRCPVSLSLGPDNRIYAGTWDTTNAGWTALLTSFE